MITVNRYPNTSTGIIGDADPVETLTFPDDGSLRDWITQQMEATDGLVFEVVS